MKRRALLLSVAAVLMAVVVGACAKKVQPVARPAPPPAATGGGGGGKPPAPPTPVDEPIVVPPEPESSLAGKDLDRLNRDSPLTPVFFELDSSDLSPDGQATLQKNAGLLKQYGSWQITIEGHCDERGTPEYNLALGERRAIAARDYLVSLGVSANRLRTVSYGKEFPFEPLHEEAAWSKNRRAHFVITGQ